MATSIPAAVTVIAVLLRCLVFYRRVRRAAKRARTTMAPTNRAQRRAELAKLGVGDAVLVVGKAAAPGKSAVRTITASDRRYLWVGTQKYRRSDGWQADAQGYETDVTWIIEIADAPRLAKAA